VSFWAVEAGGGEVGAWVVRWGAGVGFVGGFGVVEAVLPPKNLRISILRGVVRGGKGR